MAQLLIDGAAKLYGGRTVLHDVNLDLPRGEFISLLGPSGCGKTTLLRIIAGFEQPDRGRVVVGERDITNLAASQREMGMVFQAYSLFPNMTAADNVRFGLRVRKLPAAEQQQRVRTMLDLVGLATHAGKYPHQLSGGQQQRVALARALAVRPTLLLLDEPLSALDAKVRVQLREEIRRIQRETGITTVFVTHDQEEALSISDRVAVMFEGRIVQIGTPATIYQDPAHSFVASFIGISSRLPGRVVDSAGRVVEVRGLRLNVPRAVDLPTGTGCHLHLRPEDVRLDAIEDHAKTAAHPLRGTIRDTTFFGAITRLRVALDGGDDLLADVPTAHAGHLRMATRVQASWAPEAVRLLPLESPQP
jgi:putative spermidine/putrescine transport system ATP-binding protein